MIGADRASAKIYTFPTGGRDSLGAARRVAARGYLPAVSKDGRPILSATGWYHDAEVIEEPRPRKR